MWKYFRELPVRHRRNIVTLGEGGTPLIRFGRKVWIKDESINPTLTFKSRGMAVAISLARERGVRHVVLASAGNAGGAAAVYAAQAGIRATVVMPTSAPAIHRSEVRLAGGRLKLVRGTLTDAGRAVPPRIYSVGTFHEPGRVEGKKTIGLELIDEIGSPDWIFTPVGGGVALIGIYRAYRERGCRMPRLVAVQPAGCAPIVRAWERNRTVHEPWVKPRTIASGLRVPDPKEGAQILRIIRETKGAAVAVSEREIRGAVVEMAGTCGVWPCPEGAATLSAMRRLKPRGRTVLLNTGSGAKYFESAGAPRP